MLINKLDTSSWLANLKKYWWMIVIYTVPLIRFSRRRDTDDYMTVDASNLINIIGTLLLAVILLREHKTIARFWKNTCFRYYTFYYLFCAISVFWAVRMIMLYTIFRVFEMIVYFFASVILMYYFESQKKAYQFIMWISVFLGLFKIYEVYYKSGGFEEAYLHTNSYTIFGMVAFLLAVYAARNKSLLFKEYIIPLIMGGIILCLGTSSASYIATIYGLILVFSKKKTNFSIVSVVIYAIIGYICFILWEDYILDFIFPGKSMENIMTGTGRTDMWSFYFNAWLNSPILGYGFPVGEKEAQLFGWVQTSSSHNMLLSVLINTGLIGMAIWGAFLLTTISTGYRNSIINGDFYGGIFICFLCVILNSLSIPSLGSAFGSSTSVPLMLIAYIGVYSNLGSTVSLTQNLIVSNSP